MRKAVSFALLLAIIILAASPSLAKTNAEALYTRDEEAFEYIEMVDLIGDSAFMSAASTSIILFYNGEPVHSAFYGTGDADTVYRLGDISSLFVWVSVMQLKEKGMLELDRDIRDYLPNNFLRRLRFSDPITMEHLMNQNAGWEDCWRSETAFSEGDERLPLGEYLSLVEPGQAYRPGMIKTESTFSTSLAAYIIECVSGKTYPEYVKENILTPVGMNFTAVDRSLSDNPELIDRVKGGVMAFTLYPSYGAYGTVSDLSKFMKALMPAEGAASPLFSSNETLENMFSYSYKIHDYINGISHGFIERDGYIKTLGQNVNMSGFCGTFALAPENGLGIILLSSLGSIGADSTFDGLFGTRNIEIATEELPYPSALTDEFMRADHPHSGYQEFVSYLKVYHPLITMEYSKFSENKLYLYSKMYSINYRAGATYLPYFEVITQIQPYLFMDKAGNMIYFDYSDGVVNKMVFDGVEYVPTEWNRSLAVINSSIILVYLCALCSLVPVVGVVIGIVHNKRRCISTRGASKLLLPLALAILITTINNGILVSYSSANLTYAQTTWQFIINYVMSAVMIACVLGMAITWKKSELFRYQKVCYMLTIAFAIIIVLFMVFWGFYY